MYDSHIVGHNINTRDDFNLILVLVDVVAFPDLRQNTESGFRALDMLGDIKCSATFGKNSVLMQIGRMRQPVRLRTLALLVLIFSLTCLLSSLSP